MADSTFTLARFLRDLDKDSGRLARCQEVTEIQTSVENIIKALLLEVEKKDAFFKTTLINSGSFYEGTKVSLPDEFDYLIQLDSFTQSEDFDFLNELPCATVIARPDENILKKLFGTRECTYERFQWKQHVKTPFVKILDEKAKGFEGFGMKVVLGGDTTKAAVKRHGPAYVLKLKWKNGKIFKDLEIDVDLSLAVKISRPSSTMNLDLENNSALKTIVDHVPYFFALGSYRNLNLVDKENPGSSETCDYLNRLSLRVSQSCLEQEIFRFLGSDGGPTISLRLLKVLRDIMFPKELTNDRNARDLTVMSALFEQRFKDKLSPQHWALCSESGTSSIFQSSGVIISSYVLKTLVLFEWQDYPDEYQWTGNSLAQRLMNILQKLLNCLKDIKLRSFFYSDYDIFPVLEEGHLNIKKFELAILAISKLIEGLSSISHETEYDFENCLGVIKKAAEELRRKIALTYFLEEGLRWLGDAEDVFQEQVRNLLPKNAFPFLLLWQLCSIYAQVLFRKMSSMDAAPLHRNEKLKYVKKEHQLFEQITYSRLKEFNDLLDENMWLQRQWILEDAVGHGEHLEVTLISEDVIRIVHLLFKIFKKDVEKLHAFLVDEPN